MSWVVEEWKEGLPTKTLQKIQELESQLDKLKKERQQKQFQLESLEAAFQKQKQKVENEKSEVTAMKRENQSLIELCDNQEKAKQKLLHDHQVRETQVNFLEGQLTSSKKHIEKLEQELKRYKNDLERSQQSFNAGDMSLCVTPQKAPLIPYTPTKYNDLKYEDLQEKYNKEVEERKRLETELKVLHLKNLNQTPQSASHSTMNHRDIARHQSSSSVFSWQQERTPSRSSSSSHDTSLKRGFASSHFPWEQEEVPSKKGYKSDSFSQDVSGSSNDKVTEQLRVQNQELKSKMNEMEIRLQVQEKELKIQITKCQETQILLEKARMDLTEKDQTLTKSKTDLARVKVQLEQETDKSVLTEQKLKKVSEELCCQRQNAESARLVVEQKLKDREKENQQELLRQQNSLQNMEQQLNQLKMKQSQESQQAKNQFNAIQAELDKVNHAKRSLEGEIEDLKQKLSRSEQALLNCQKNESDFKKTITEAKSDQNAAKCQYEKKCKEALTLEEDLKTVNLTLKQNKALVEDFKNKNTFLEAELKTAYEKLQDHSSEGLQTMKITILKLEKERDFAQDLLKKREQDMEEIKVTLTNAEDESKTLKILVESKEREYNDLLNANASLSNWKTEQEKATTQLCREKEDLSKKMNDLERVVQTQLDQIRLMENDKINFNIQIKALQELVDVKVADLDIQKTTCSELRRKQEEESQKLRKETETFSLQVNELKAQLETQKLTACVEQTAYFENALQKEQQMKTELHRQNDELLRSQLDIKTHLAEAEDAHRRLLDESRSQMQSLENDILSKQNQIESVTSSIKEKDGAIQGLLEKLRLHDADMHSAHQSIEQLNHKLQELSLLKESWSTERETLTALISANQRDIARLTDENKQILQVADEALKSKQVQLAEVNADWNHKVDMDDNAEGKSIAPGSVDRCNAEHANESENLEREVAELKEKYEEVQRTNQELSTLVNDLKIKELAQNQIIEELRVCLEETGSLKGRSQNDHDMDHFGYVKESSMTLDGVSRDLVVGCDTERNTLQEESGKGQEVACGIGGPENINNSGDYDVVMKEDALIQSSSKVLDLGSTQTDQRKVTPSFEEQKTFLFECKNENLVDYQHITTTFDAENDVPLKMSKTALLSDNTTDLCDLDEQTLDFGNHSLNITNLQSASPSGLTFCCTPSNGHRPRKSLTGDISLNRSFEEQLHAFASMMVNEEGDYNKLLDIYQADVQELKKQYDSEIEKLQQKLKEQAKEMDTKLEEEKKEKEHLSLELEAARLELQYLDLSARSFLSFDVDDLKSFDTNQSVCTVLPIGSLNLNNSCVEKSDKPKEIQKSPDSKVGCKNKIDPEALILEKSLGTGELENQSPNCSLIAGTRKNPPDIQNRQTVIENLGLHAQQFSKENLKLLQHVKDGEREIETSDAVTKDLNEKVEKHKSEFGQETDSSEVHNGTMELEEERTCLFEKLEILAHEKQQLSGRVHDLEKDLVDLSNTTERLKIQLSDLSAVKENFERSSEEWKEKYLQAENELRRAKSENGNIENHALSLESDLDTLQVKFQKLQDQNEEHLKCVSSLRERLDVALEEKNRIIQELGSANEDKEEYMELYHQLQRKECEFEASKANTRELLRLLEDEIRALKSELQTAKSITEQLSADAEQLNKKQIDDLQNQMQQIQQEKVILLEKINDLETQARTAINEKTELSRTLECCQFEKQEMVARLNIAQEEVALMRAGIEKLKKQIESDEKKRRHMVEKLRDGERNSDRLNDKIENLERELSMSEENLEGVVIQNETIKEELERVMSQKDILEKETNTFRRKVVEQEKDLLERQEKIIELEAALLNMVNAMEAKEMAQRDLKEESEKVLLALQTQLNELQEQKVLSDDRHQAVSANHLEALSLVEQSNTDLLHQLEEAQAIIRNLEASVEKLTLDLENHRQTLDEKTRQILILEEKLEHAGQWEQKFSSELLSFEEERETLNNEKKVLKARVDQLEDQVHAMSTARDSSEKTIADLRTLCGDLQEQLDTSSSENQALLQQVSVLSESCSDLQGRLCDADQRVKTAQETHSVEREALEEQIGELQRQNQESSAFLTAAVSQRTEMEETVANLQKELDVQLQKNNEDTFKYDARLSEADLKQQALVNEIKQHKDKVQDYQEKLTLAEAHLTAQKQELECLKTSNEELNQSLGKSEQQMMELNQIKADISEMKKENAVTCSNLDLWMKSCKRLEQEKGQLEEQIKRHEANLESFQEKPKNAEMDNSSSDLLAELEELKQSLEEKTLEADESVEKYCTLIIETHKLEEANDMLQRQVDLLTMKLKELETNKEVKSSPRKPGALMKTCKGKGEKDRRSTQGAVKQSTKRCRAQEAADEPKYTTPTSQRQTKRVKKTASSTVATPPISDDGHFELDGLPEVVKQGFADIPSGKRSPFVLCRTALPLRKSPRLSAQKPSPSNLSTIQNADLENSPSFPNLTEGGSNSQKLNKTELMQLEAAVRSIELSSPLSAYNKRKAPVSESPVLCQKETRKQSNIEALHDKSESDETCNVQ